MGILLAGAGHRPLVVASRSVESARRAARHLGCATTALDGADAIDADVVLIGALDSAVARIASSLVERLPKRSLMCHLSGSLGLEPFHRWIDAGGDAAALHPVQTCPSIEAAVERLPGSAWGVTCTAGGRDRALRMIRDDLGGTPVEIPGEARPLWHAASVTTSNGISALLAAGEAMLETIGISEPHAVLGPLAAGSVANARKGGGGARTLTGPLVRGEVETIERHLEALAVSPKSLQAYLSAARLMLLASGDHDDARSRAIRDLLERA